MASDVEQEVYDLTISFGRQVRLQCVCCKKYLADQECSSCGTRYEQLGERCWRIVKEPRDG